MRVEQVITDIWAGDHRPMRMRRTTDFPVSFVSDIPSHVKRPEGACAICAAVIAEVTLTFTVAGEDLYDAQQTAEGALIWVAMGALGPVELDWPILRLQEAWDYRVRLFPALRFAGVA